MGPPLSLPHSLLPACHKQATSDGAPNFSQSFPDYFVAWFKLDGQTVFQIGEALPDGHHVHFPLQLIPGLGLAGARAPGAPCRRTSTPW